MKNKNDSISKTDAVASASARTVYHKIGLWMAITAVVMLLCTTMTASSFSSSRNTIAMSYIVDVLTFPIKLDHRLAYPVAEPLLFAKQISEFPPNPSGGPKKPALTGYNRLIASHLSKKKAHLLHPIILKVAGRHEVDPALIKAIIMAESGYNPKAISRKGAKGLMQLMPTTAKALGIKDIFNPEHNIDGGVRYFKKLVTRYNGNVRLALAAYNAGSRKVRKYQGVPPFKSTLSYIQKVMTYYEYFKHRTVDLAENA